MDAHEAVEDLLRSTAKVRHALARNRTHRQVRTEDECSVVRALALTWFRERTGLPASAQASLDTLNRVFADLLRLADRAASRQRHFDLLAEARSGLEVLRTQLLTHVQPTAQPQLPGSDPPAFGKLVSDAQMQTVLGRRWHETRLCMSVQANLAATVMMGGLLEGLLLARLNRMSDKAPAFRAASAPRDAAGKTLPLRDWTLRHYIDVGHELAWIGQSSKDVSEILRDYRNYIHGSSRFPVAKF